MNTNSSCVIYAYLILRHHPGQRETDTETETERSHILAKNRALCRVAAQLIPQWLSIVDVSRAFYVTHCCVFGENLSFRSSKLHTETHSLQNTIYQRERLTLVKYIICNILVRIVWILYMKYAVNNTLPLWMHAYQVVEIV